MKVKKSLSQVQKSQSQRSLRTQSKNLAPVTIKTGTDFVRLFVAEYKDKDGNIDVEKQISLHDTTMLLEGAGGKKNEAETPAWMNPANPRCGAIEPWSKHKPYEPIVGKTKEAKESQCHACKVRACNSGLPGPEETGGCRCISYKDGAGNYATDCKNLLNKNLPVDYEKCGEVRDCKALEGQCVSAKFKMDSAKRAPWMKKGWKGAKSYGVRADGRVLLSTLGLLSFFGIM